MSTNAKLTLLGLIVVVCLIFLISHYYQPHNHPAVKSAAVAATIAPTRTSARCTSVNGLPDHTCTPGAIDSRVTQENIQQTICAPGYTRTVRPPVSYTNILKTEQIKIYGYSDLNPDNYEEDHLIPLELGGAPSDPDNLWPEPGGVPNPKDEIENLCHHKVCNYEITLTRAQSEIAADWHSACQRL